ANQLLEAEAAHGAAVRMRSFAEAWLALGQVRFLRGNLAGADEAFTAAVGLRPTWAEALYSLAQVREQLGEPADAAQLYRAALENQLAEPLAAYARDRLARGQ
ncbi:MAG: tetratricopeptide repeat protein, partial [Armatimonadetes bacterium]|nr:tetratricopeptide repeat protein [Armatimonadota bacterium]